MAIASTLDVSDRYLEPILVTLRDAGLVDAHRGRSGGYSLATAPRDLTVGEAIRLFDGSLRPVDCTACGGARVCPSQEDCAFADLWRQAALMMAALYESVTFEDLLKRDPTVRDGLLAAESR